MAEKKGNSIKGSDLSRALWLMRFIAERQGLFSTRDLWRAMECPSYRTAQRWAALAEGYGLIEGSRMLRDGTKLWIRSPIWEPVLPREEKAKAPA